MKSIEEMSLIEESIRGAISGIDGVDSLLADAGYMEDSSTRLHLAIVRSLLRRVGNANEKAVAPLTDSQEGSADRFGDRDVVPANFARELELRIKELEEYKADIEEETRMVMSEKCADDEVHCTCVPVLRQKIAELEKEVNNWKEFAAHESRNKDYYIALLDKIAETFGERSYISDDGSKQDTPLRAKMPELVAELEKQVEDMKCCVEAKCKQEK